MTARFAIFPYSECRSLRSSPLSTKRLLKTIWDASVSNLAFGGAKDAVPSFRNRPSFGGVDVILGYRAQPCNPRISDVTVDHRSKWRSSLQSAQARRITPTTA